MAPNTRPSLTSLADRMAKKDPAPAAAGQDQASAPPKPAAAPKDARVQVLVRMTTAERKALRQIALDKDTTVQAIVEDAIRDVLRRHGSSTA